MADLKKTIEIIFGGTDELSGTLDSMDNSITGFANNIESSTQPLADFASTVLKTELAIGAMGAAVLIYANEQASNLVGAQASLNKVLQEGEGNASDYADEIKDIALEFGVFGDVTTETAAEFKQAGFDIDTALSLVETALTAVQISELSADQAADLLKRTLAGLGVESSEAAEQANHFLDAWNEVSNNFNATAKEIAEGTALLAPAAKAAGLSFDELVGFLVPMIESLGSGTESANALKVGLANLISDNKKVTSALSELGVAQRDLNGDLRLSGDILKDLAEVWPTLSESQQANTGILLFGKEQYVRMNTVLNNYDVALKGVTTSINSNNSANEELAIAMDKASTAAARLQVAFNFAAAAVGEQFLDSTKNVNESLTTLAISFTDVVNEGGLKPLFDFLNPLLDEFSKNIDSIAKNLPAAFQGIDFSGLIKSFKNIGFEFGQVFDFDLSTAEGLEEAIQGIVDVLASLNNIFAGVIEGFAPVIEVFKSLADSAGEADSGTAKFAGNILGYGATINTFSGWISGLTGVFSALTDAIILIVGAKSLGLLPTSFGKAGTAASTLATKLGKGGLIGAIYGVTLELASMAGETDLVRGALGKFFENIDNLVGGPLSQSAKLMEEQAKASREVAEATDKQSDSIDELNDAHVEAYNESIKYDEAVNQLAADTELAAKVNAEMELSQSRLSKQMIDLGLNIDGTKFSVEESGKAVKVTSGEFEGWYKVLKDGVEVFYKTKTAAEEASKGIDKAAESEKKLAEEAKKAEEAAAKLALEYSKLEVEMEKIASNERIANMELFVSLETSRIEADAKKVVAAFESISETYAATTQSISELYGILGDPDISRLQEIDIERAADEARKRAQEQWELQKELLEAQIEQTEAQTDRLNKGDALIKVDGGDLQPELYAMMQSLFKSIRIEMNRDYEAYLLGLG